MKDELATTTKGYEEKIATMSEHLASMNEQITSQNDKIDRLQQQLHTNPKVIIEKNDFLVVLIILMFIYRMQKKAKNEMNTYFSFCGNKTQNHDSQFYKLIYLYLILSFIVLF